MYGASVGVEERGELGQLSVVIYDAGKEDGTGRKTEGEK